MTKRMGSAAQIQKSPRNFWTAGGGSGREGGGGEGSVGGSVRASGHAARSGENSLFRGSMATCMREGEA